MKLKLLLSLLIPCTCYSQEQSPQQPDQAPNTAQSILDITKDILKSGTGMIKSAISTGRTFYKRARQEAGYFGQELQSFIHTEQEIIAKKTVDEIAAHYEAVLITLTLETLNSQDIEQVAAACTPPIDLTQLKRELIRLNSFIPCTLGVLFVPQLSIRPLEDSTRSKTSCTLTFRIKRPKKLYQWVEMIEQYRYFEQSMAFVKNRNEYYTFLLTLITKASQNNLLADIVVS